jgi:hypothetical protein
VRLAIVAVAAPAIALGVFKAAVATRLGGQEHESYLHYLAGVVTGATRVNVGVYGVGLPYVLWWIFRHALDVGHLVVAAVFGASIATLTWWTSPADATPTEMRRGARWLLSVGVLALVLGYAVFVVPTEGLAFSSASLDNRIGIAAGLGVAAAFVGLLATVLPSKAFPVAIGVLGGVMLLITTTLGGFWGDAYKSQQRLVAEMTAGLPALPRASTVVVDGACLERGGAYVLTGKRDVTGILTVRYPGSALRGSAITNEPDIRSDGLLVRTYGQPDLLKYGPTLLMFDVRSRRVVALTDESAALAYFRASAFSPRRDCPPGFAWRGRLVTGP